MAINTKAIKSRIKSVKNTKKITKAMEMVSAAKMRKAVEADLRAREFAVHAKELLQRLSGLERSHSVYLDEREEKKKVLCIIVSSNRGLCGSFNAHVIKKAEDLLSDIRSGGDIDVDVLGVGKKSTKFAKKHNLNLIGVYDSLREDPTYNDILPIAKQAMDGFKDETYDEVYLVNMQYVSSLVQQPTAQKLLPLNRADVEEVEGETHLPIGAALFEPSIEDIVEVIIPRLIEAQVYQSILENAAGEHSARMIAMKNASDNATDMIKDLTLTYNKGRQAAITQEIAEIAGGAAALE